MTPTVKIRPNSRALRQILKPRVVPDRKQAAKRGPLARKIRKIRRRLESLPPRLWLFCGALILIGLVVWWMFAPAPKGAGPAAPPSKAGQIAGPQTPGTPAAEAPPDAAVAGKQLGFIKSVRLQPGQPGRTDNLKAEVTAAPGAPEGLVYTYQWKVNDRIIEEAKADTLNLSAFKKQDRIAVTVTPSDGVNEGFAVVSPEVAIHSIAPSLELKIKNPAVKIPETVELQLVSVAPDSGQISFSLTPPLIPGMTVDKSSGKISWRRQPDQQGTLRFGAAVEDDNGTKVTKTFEVTVK